MDLRLSELLIITALLTGVQSVIRQYHLITDLKNWTQAQTYCRSKFVDLAMFEDSSDLASLLGEAQKYSFTSEAWVGLYNDINSWRWSFNNTPLDSFRNWGFPEPDNYRADQECASISPLGYWRDDFCFEKRPFICFDARSSATSQYILISDTRRTWQESQAYCREHHTDLASARGDAENSVLMSKLGMEPAWMGLYRDSWKWSDNSTASAIMWAQYQPDNAGGKDNCGFMVRSYGGYYGFPLNLLGGRRIFSLLGDSTSSFTGMLDDDNCSVLRAFFCYSYVKEKKKQLVRLTVKSSQDVTNPAVKAAMLEKMQQKLGELGLAKSTTLRWSEEPDGDVFYKINSDEVETIQTCQL